MSDNGLELRRVAMPLVAPFRTSFGTEYDRDVLLVRWVTPDAEGWGECVAMSQPLYSPEYVDGAAEVIRRFLVPALAGLSHVDAVSVEPVFAKVKGHPMAKAAVQTAVLDAQLRAAGMSFGHTSVPYTLASRPVSRWASWMRYRTCWTRWSPIWTLAICGSS